jgi:hypothetical protein
MEIKGVPNTRISLGGSHLHLTEALMQT